MKKLLRGAKKFMQEKIEAAKQVIENPVSRFTTGCIMVGIGIAGIGIIASCFLPQFN